MICSTTTRTLLSLAGSAIMTLGTFSMLQASAPWNSPRTEFLRYHDSDLNRPEDAARFYKRLEAAAERVCAPLVVGGLATKKRAHECIDRALSRAVSDVNHPQLNALHSATIGRWQAASDQQLEPGV